MRKFEVETEFCYTGLDIQEACDHYNMWNQNFYKALKHRFSKINTQISKLLYMFVFNLSWIYFVYVYSTQMFAFNLGDKHKRLGQMDQLLRILFNTTSTSSSTEAPADLNFKQEQFISFMLVTLLVIERKIIEVVSKNIDELEVSSTEQVNVTSCSDTLMAHLDLYIAVREMAPQLLKSKDKKASHQTSVGKLHDKNVEAINEKLDLLIKKMDKDKLDTNICDSLALEESKRVSNSEIMQRITRGESLDDISDNHKLRLCLHERTPYLEKIIFFNVIKNKFSYAQLEYALMLHMQRIGIILLMTIVTFSPSLINVGLLLIIFIMEVRNKSFTDEIGLLCLISCLLIFKDDVLMVISLHETWKKGLVGWEFLFYHDIKVVYFATGFLLICNVFVLISIGLTKSILVGINTHKISKSKIFWSFTDRKKKGTCLNVDHKKWISEGNSLLLTLKNLLYIYPLEIYLIIMVTVTMLLHEGVTPYVMGFIGFPYLISFLNFKKKETKDTIERYYFDYFILLCWSALLIYYPLTTYFKTREGEFTWHVQLKVEFTLPLSILINKTYQEFMGTVDYKDSQAKLQKQRILMSSLINYCYTYDYNEQKLRENINIFVKQNHVIECTEKISNIGENTKMNFDSDVVDDLFTYDEDLLPVIYQKCSTFQKLKIQFYLFLYQSMLAFNYEGIFESVFYLYRTFKKKNNEVINSKEEPNLNQFLKLESDMMLESIKQVEQFYLRLKEKDSDYLKKFDDEFHEINCKIEDSEQKDKIREARRQDADSMVVDNAANQLSKVILNEVDSDIMNAANVIHSIMKREDIEYENASQVLFDYVNGIKKRKKTDNDSFTFKLAGNKDLLVFQNIQPYFIEQTNYFTKFEYMVFFKLLLGIFLSNMEMIIIILMTAVHLWAGGVYPIVIFTIVFFILIEERPGKYKLWMIIDGIYFVVLLAILFITNSSMYIPVNYENNRSRNKLPSERQAELVLLFIGKLDSIYGICVIFFMIILLRINLEKLGFYEKDIMSVETLPMAVHRIVINKNFDQVFDKEVEKKKLKVQAIEDLILGKYKKSRKGSFR